MTEITNPEIAAYDREQACKREVMQREHERRLEQWRVINRICDERAFAMRAHVWPEADLRQMYGDRYEDLAATHDWPRECEKAI